MKRPIEARTFLVDNEMPSLNIPWPRCGHCGNDVDIDDGNAWCETCRVAFNSIDDGAASKADNDQEGSAVPCEIIDAHPAHREEEYERNGTHWVIGPRRPCILPSGHGGKHLCPYEVTTTPLTSEANA